MQMNRVTAIALALFASAAVTADWPQWRHDAAWSGYADELVEPPLELKWTLDETGPGTTPLAMGDSLYVNSRSVGFARIAYDTGEVIWQRPNIPKLVAIDGEFIVAAIGEDLPGPETLGLVVFRAETGELVGSITTDDALNNPGAGEGGPHRPYWYGINDGMIAVSDMLPGPNGRRDLEPWIRFFDIASGRLIDETRCIANLVMGPTGNYVPNSPYHSPFRIRAWNDELMLLAHFNVTVPEPIYVEGEGWVRPQSHPIEGPWALASGRPTAMTPEDARGRGLRGLALSREAPFVVGWYKEAHRRWISARDAATGELLWSVAGTNASHFAVDSVAAHFTGADGIEYALDLQTGEVIWQTAVGKSLELQKAEDEMLGKLGQPAPPHAMASPILADNALWLVWDDNLIGMHAETGELLWSAEPKRWVIRDLTAHEGWLYYTHANGLDAWGPIEEAEDEAEADVEEEGNAGG